MALKPYNVLINNWIVRVRQAADPKSNYLMVLLHGWTGDENSMSIFSSLIPEYYWVFAPRAPYAAASGGYEWATVIPGKWPTIDKFIPVAHQLHDQIQKWTSEFNIQQSPIHVLGFSQGAALTYTYSILHPNEVKTATCISGFLPSDSEKYIQKDKLQKQKFFIAHGTADDIIPVSQAYLAVKTLQDHGAEVKYCEAKTGHKISSNCFQELVRFLDEE